MYVVVPIRGLALAPICGDAPVYMRRCCLYTRVVPAYCPYIRGGLSLIRGEKALNSEKKFTRKVVENLLSSNSLGKLYNWC